MECTLNSSTYLWTSENKVNWWNAPRQDCRCRLSYTRGWPPHLACHPFWLVFSNRLYLLFYYRYSIEISHQHYYILWQQVCKIFCKWIKTESRETQWFELTYLKNARKCDGELRPPSIWRRFKKMEIYYNTRFLYRLMQDRFLHLMSKK